MPDSFGAILGRRMAERRAELRLTQGQLAALVWPGDSNAETTRKGDISKLESGKVPNPQATTVLRIAKALEIEAEIDALRQRAQLTPAQQLEVIPTLSRDQLELLASRFGILAPHDRSDGDLRGLLTDKATEYRALKAQIDAIDERTAGLGNLKAAAKDAADRMDFAEVESLLSRVDEMETTIAAETKELRADTALLRGQVEAAFTHLTAAADSFAGIDPLEPAQRRVDFADRLYEHGLRYGGPGLALAARMLREALARIDRATQPQLWAAAQNNLAAALQGQGSRTAGTEGVALLDQAVTAYSAAQQVYTRQAHPLHWAMTQNNLANALTNQGIRTAGSEGAALLDQAIKAFRSALEVRTRQAHPLDWATTQNNLANALQKQGSRTAGPRGAALLDQAVTAYRLALGVYSRQAHPLDWAMTQNNLANVLQGQGSRTTGSEGAALLDQAVKAFRLALEVRTRQAHPVRWAETQENLAILHEVIARHDTCTDPVPPLRVALQHVDAALTIYDPVHLPFRQQQATAMRERILAALSVAGG